MGYGIFNVRTDVNACDCTRRCTVTVRESALKVDSERKIPFRTGESNLRQPRAGPTLYQLSYIPIPVVLAAPPAVVVEEEYDVVVVVRSRRGTRRSSRGAFEVQWNALGISGP